VSGEQERKREQEQEGRVDAGQQVLASFTSMGSPLSSLPPGAYRNLLVVSTKSPGHVEGRLAELGVSAANVGLIPLAGSEYEYDGALWTTDAIRPNDPTGLSVAVTSAMEHLAPGAGWLLVEDLNVLAMYVEEETVCRLLSHLAKQARKRNVRGVYGVVRSAISEETYGNYRQAVDAELDLR
jgi:hypothetical protein